MDEKLKTRINSLEVFTQIEKPDMDFVEGKIREAELRFKWMGRPPKIEFMALDSRLRLLDFIIPDGNNEWKAGVDEIWGGFYKFKNIAANLIAEQNVVKDLMENRVRVAVNLLKKSKQYHRITPLQVGKFSERVSWVAAGFMGYEIFPMPDGTDNPYEPLFELMEAGYMARRFDDGWKVGYIPKVMGDGEQTA